MTGCWSRAASLQLRTARPPSRHCSAYRQHSRFSWCGTQRASLCRAALPSACLPVTVPAGMELFPLQCLLWRCVLVLSALRAVLQAVVQSAVLRSCASRPCALQHSGRICAAPRNLPFPGASTAPLHVHLCVRMCAEPYTHVQRLPRTHACAFTHVQAHPCTALCAHSIRVHASVCKTQQPCAKALMHAFVFMHTHTCVHTILLHTHVHKDTSAALALHTAICMHTRAKLSPTDTVHTPTCSAHSCSAPSLHTPVCTHACTHSSRTKCCSCGTANTQAVGNVRRKGAPLRSFILLSLMKALGHSWSPILRCGLLRGSSSVGYGGPGMVMGVLSGTVGVGEHRRGLRHKGRPEPPSNRRDP